MIEPGHTPVRPPLRTAEQAAPQQNEPPKQTGSPDAQRPKPAPASNAYRYARRAYSAKGGNVSEAFAAAREMTARAAHDIRRQHGSSLTREESLRLVSAFQSALVPRRRAGRRPKPQVTAAYLDWKAGMRGVALHRKHIPGSEKHNRYRRMAEEKRLMDAIRSRCRRENTTRE